jgi:hypothetical protein
VLAKEAGYFNKTEYAYQSDYFEAASVAARGIQFVAGVRERILPEFFPSNITNLGFSSTEFYTRLAESQVLVGVGSPVTYIFSFCQHVLN